MGSGSRATEASASSTDNLSTIARIAGIVRRPRPTFEAIVRNPRWAGLLAIVFLVSFAASAAFLATDVGQQALVDRWERVAVAFGQPVDDARYAEFQQLSRQGVLYAAVTTAAGLGSATLVLSAVLFAVFSGLKGRPASYHQVLAVSTHAGIILALRNVLSAPVSYRNETMAIPTTLVTFFSIFDEASPLARFFGVIDVFVVWWLIVLAIGISVLYRQRARTTATVFVGAYVAVALGMVVTMAVFGETA